MEAENLRVLTDFVNVFHDLPKGLFFVSTLIILNTQTISPSKIMS